MSNELYRVAILDDFQNAASSIGPWHRLAGKADVQIFTDHVTGEQLVERLASFDIVMAIRERTAFDRALIEKLPNLKLIVTAGPRNRGIDLVACRDHGIVVCGTDAGSTPTVELAWGLILALARHIPAEDRALREGQWQTRMGFGLRGRMLGVLGLGRLGSKVATLGQAFGMDVVAWSQNLTAERAAEIDVRRVDKDELFGSSDVVTIHLLLSERTRSLVGRAELGLMKPTAVLVNTSRAPIIDEAALVEALQSGQIAGAGLDVFEQEPLPLDALIRTAPNTVLTPHLGYATRDSYEVYFPQAVEDIEAWLAGDPIRVLEG